MTRQIIPGELTDEEEMVRVFRFWYWIVAGLPAVAIRHLMRSRRRGDTPAAETTEDEAVADSAESETMDDETMDDEAMMDGDYPDIGTCSHMPLRHAQHHHRSGMEPVNVRFTPNNCKDHYGADNF